MIRDSTSFCLQKKLSLKSKITALQAPDRSCIMFSAHLSWPLQLIHPPMMSTMKLSTMSPCSQMLWTCSGMPIFVDRERLMRLLVW